MITLKDTELQHFGVKGMKWGVRKTRVKSGATKGKKKSRETDTKKLNKLVKKGKAKVDEMQAEHVKNVVKNTALVASGALWVASAFIPGNVAGKLNGAAAIANVASIVLGKPNTNN